MSDEARDDPVVHEAAHADEPAGGAAPHAGPAVDLDLATAVRSVHDEPYWRQRTEAQANPRWLACDPAAHGGSWKALFCERYVAQLVGSTPVGGEAAPQQQAALRWALAACAPFVRALTLTPSAAAPALHLEDVFGATYSTLTSLTIRPAVPHTLSPADLAALCVGLSRCESLVVLDLSACGLDDGAVATLAEALATNVTITALNLSGNEVGDAGAVALCAALLPPTPPAGSTSRLPPPLAHLDLSDNAIGPVGAAALGHAVSGSVCLLSLSLSHCPITDDGASALLLPLQPSGPNAARQARPKLVELHLRACGLGLRACVALAAVVRAPGGPLAGCHVDVSLNSDIGGDSSGGAQQQAPPAGLAKLEAAFGDSLVPRLGALRLAACGITPDERRSALELSAAGSEAGLGSGWIGKVVDAQLLRPPPQTRPTTVQ